jgi:hypothetical protein
MRARTMPTPSVPMTAVLSARLPDFASACAAHRAHEVLPLVPVTPTVNMPASGWP